MRQKASLFTSILVSTLVLIAYQNCSVYKSDGRKNLELLLNENTIGNCLPYVDNNIATNIMESEVTAYLNQSPPAGSVAECRITASAGATKGIDRVVCGMANSYGQAAGLYAQGILTMSTEEQVALLNQDIENFIETVPDYQSALLGGSFGYSYKVGDNVVLRFLGANNTSSVGVACYVVFGSLDEYEDADIGKEKAKKMLSDFAHEITKQL